MQYRRSGSVGRRSQDEEMFAASFESITDRIEASQERIKEELAGQAEDFRLLAELALDAQSEVYSLVAENRTLRKENRLFARFKAAITGSLHNGHAVEAVQETLAV